MQGLPVAGAIDGCGAELKWVTKRGFTDVGRRACLFHGSLAARPKRISPHAGERQIKIMRCGFPENRPGCPNKVPTRSGQAGKKAKRP